MTEPAETQARTAESTPKKRRKFGAHVQLFIDRKLYARIQPHAKSEGLTAVNSTRREQRTAEKEIGLKTKEGPPCSEE
jgi:hypothetical protein